MIWQVRRVMNSVNECLSDIRRVIWALVYGREYMRSVEERRRRFEECLRVAEKHSSELKKVLDQGDDPLASMVHGLQQARHVRMLREQDD